MKYKITTKNIYCDLRGCRVDCYGHTVFDCLECPNCGLVDDEVQAYTQEEYIGVLNRGNVIITKVDVIK